MEQKEMQTEVHIGNKIQQVLAEKKMLKAQLARALGISPPSASYMFDRDSIDVKTLVKVSRALGHNFLKYYNMDGVEPISTAKVAEGKDEKDKMIDGLKEKIAALEKEIDGMKREAIVKENEWLRKINSLLERK
ncbi:MAG: helix-turn-helix domain-containing protein [Bacteroidia bacterium]|nr:helix-turn-helix domain-containing protein [Bacteroidia bacterium]